eukprot:TRINITY_DN11036_c0_g1_i6.p1 TRINITY_DN11036_c0_g1~~TRINITY_DN11036_c0_g1_i6.p1  ORF type:complete len:135 (+),score=11.54 TRINITY_DN11036_c0_g1_i6:1141-1545(+)
MMLTTSNITNAIDLAFIDRADIKAYIGPPSLQGRYDMLQSSVMELLRVGIIEPNNENQQLMDFSTTVNLSSEEGKPRQTNSGLSGRVLRKLPFLAHTLQDTFGTCSLQTFLNHLHKSVVKEKQDRSNMESHVEA